MQLNYVKSQSTVKPELIDTTSSKTTVYLRKNIIERQIANEDNSDKWYDPTVSVYEYDEAKLSKEEYQEYLKEISGSDTLQTIEDLKAENQMLNEQVDILTACLVEMSEIVYA